MKPFQLLCLIVLLASCHKSIQQEDGAEASRASNDIVVPVPPYEWTYLSTSYLGSGYPMNDLKIPNFVAPIGNDIWCFTGGCHEKAFKLNSSTKKWVRQPAYPSNFCLFYDSYYLFSYQSKLYYGIGGLKDAEFGSFDPVTGEKRTLAPFPGADSIGVPRTFIIGGYGYLYFEGGYASFWRYHFASNTWTNMGESPTGTRHDATVVVIDDKLYVGLGWESQLVNGEYERVYKKDWKVVTIGSSWAAVKAPFPGTFRGHTEQFVIGDNIFVGFGSYINTADPDSHTIRRFDLYKYNIPGNSWKKMPDYPGMWAPGYGSNYGNLSMFAQGNAGYLVMGGLSEFWRIGNTPLITPQL